MGRVWGRGVSGWGKRGQGKRWGQGRENGRGKGVRGRGRGGGEEGGEGARGAMKGGEGDKPLRVLETQGAKSQKCKNGLTGG